MFLDTECFIFDKPSLYINAWQCIICQNYNFRLNLVSHYSFVNMNIYIYYNHLKFLPIELRFSLNWVDNTERRQPTGKSMSLRRGISRISEEWYRDLEGIGNRKSLALAEYEASLTEPPYRDICTSSNTMSSSVDRIIHCFLCHVYMVYIVWWKICTKYRSRQRHWSHLWTDSYIVSSMHGIFCLMEPSYWSRPQWSHL